MLDLSVGSNTLTVTVTAQDGNAELTYTVTVTRHTADTLVSNTHLTPTGDEEAIMKLRASKPAPTPAATQSPQLIYG